MRKVPITTNLEESEYQRLALLAKVDRRTIAEIARMAIEQGLEDLERELEEKKATFEARQQAALPAPAPVHAGPSNRRKTA